MKYTDKYEDFNIDYYLIEAYIDELPIEEGRIKDWLINSPKIRDLQRKANHARLNAARSEVEQRRKIDQAKDMGKSVDAGRMWAILQQKLDAYEDLAREYEAEAARRSEGSVYLSKIQRVERMKGMLRVNNERIKISQEEEARELNRRNKEYMENIRKETELINDKIKRDTEQERRQTELESVTDPKKKVKTPSMEKPKSDKFTYRDADEYILGKRAQYMRKEPQIIGPGGKIVK